MPYYLASANRASNPNLPAHLQHDREIHVIISNLSGQHKAEEYFNESLQPLLDKLELRYSVHRTTSSQSIVEWVHSIFLFNARKGTKQTIILLSGDGGVVDIVNTMTSALMRDTYDDYRPASVFFKPVLVLIPMGTANALAWSSGVAKDPVKTLMEGRARSLPSFEVKVSPGTKLVSDEGRARQSLAELGEEEVILYGAVVFSWGLHASLVATSDTTEYRRHGLNRFKMAAEELIKTNHAYKGTIKYQIQRDTDKWTTLIHPSTTSSTSDSIPATNSPPTETKTEHSYILTTLVSNLEETFTISPSSTPVSGDMHLVAIGHVPPGEITRLLTLAYQGGKHVEEKEVTYQKIERLRIDFLEDGGDGEQYRMICIDGKILAVEKGGWVEVRNLPGVGMHGRRVVELVC